MARLAAVAVAAGIKAETREVGTKAAIKADGVQVAAPKRPTIKAGTTVERIRAAQAAVDGLKVAPAAAAVADGLKVAVTREDGAKLEAREATGVGVREVARNHRGGTIRVEAIRVGTRTRVGKQFTVL